MDCGILPDKRGAFCTEIANEVECFIGDRALYPKMEGGLLRNVGVGVLMMCRQGRRLERKRASDGKADVKDLKSFELNARAGSTPASPTILRKGRK